MGVHLVFIEYENDTNPKRDSFRPGEMHKTGFTCRIVGSLLLVCFSSVYDELKDCVPTK